MNWLSRLLDGISPPATGLEIDEADPIALRVPPEPGPLIQALNHLVGLTAVLYWEGPADRLLAAWLRRQTLEPFERVSVGISPVHDFYHIPLTTGVLAELAARLERARPIPSRVHLHVRENGRVLLQWRQAFGDAAVLLSRTLRREQVDSFAKAVRAL